MISPSLLNQSCYIAGYTGQYSVLGDESHTDPVKHRCRIDYNTKLVYNTEGVQVPSIATVFVDTDISDHDWIYLDAHVETVAVSDICRYNFTSWNTGDMFPSPAVSRLVYGTARKPLQVNHLYTGAGQFSHCEVFV